MTIAETNNAARMRLSPEQVRHYEQEGYVLYHQPVFGPERFARLQAIFDENLERYTESELNMVHLHDARLLEFLLADEVLDLVEPLVGPDIGLWASHLICKQPFTGKATPWHEDSTYWNGRVSTQEGICTVWLALDEATPENGCMKVIPGTHHNGFSQYEQVDVSRNIFSSQIVPEQVDESRAVYFSLQPNQCSLHEARLIHGADPNTSPKRRAGYTMRYFPATTRIFPEKLVGHKVWLARGKDVAGNAYENA